MSVPALLVPALVIPFPRRAAMAVFSVALAILAGCGQQHPDELQGMPPAQETAMTVKPKTMPVS